MKSAGKPAYVLGSARIPFVKSSTAYAGIPRKDLMVAALNGLIAQYGLAGRLIEDTALGAVINGARDFNLAREAVLSTQLHPHSPGYNVQRACGTGLETTWQIGLKLHTGAIATGISGGVDTNSDVPIEISKPLRDALLEVNAARTLVERVKPFTKVGPKALIPVVPNVNEPRTGLSMGDHTELMVKEWKIPRGEQDELALASHLNAAKAYDEGFFKDMVHPYKGLERDGTLRGDTTLERLAKLKPAFDRKAGTLTAGNSSPLTDGAACVLMANDDGAAALGVKPLAQLIDVQVTAVDFVRGAGLLIAPAKAVAQLLTRNRLTFADFDYFEIHEAFAGQVLCTLRAWESEEYCRTALGLPGALGSLDRKRMNVVGSSLSVGHPFAATGARIVGVLAKLLASGKKRGLISICTAGGMGIAAIMESA
jgi:acetyl-CoA C-acetyltransferase